MGIYLYGKKSMSYMYIPNIPIRLFIRNMMQIAIGYGVHMA